MLNRNKRRISIKLVFVILEIGGKTFIPGV